MLISNLIPTHNDLRNVGRFYSFLDNFHNTGMFINRTNKILILSIDNIFYLNDGHHEISAAIAYGLDTIPESNYNIMKVSLNQMLSVNFDIGWVTPYNPATHCRILDLTNFKKIAFEHKDIDFIYNNQNLYLEERKVHSFIEIVKKYVKIQSR